MSLIPFFTPIDSNSELIDLLSLVLLMEQKHCHKMSAPLGWRKTGRVAAARDRTSENGGYREQFRVGLFPGRE